MAPRQTHWTDQVKAIKPDRIAWVREKSLSARLVAEYANDLRAVSHQEIVEYAVLGGEERKQLVELEHWFHLFDEWGLTRHSLVVTTGGGALSDAIGFAASVWRRGVKVFHIPTTTLAAIDAAWGGKTALNWKKVKNQIGTIHPPVAVHIDARWLTTLPEREFRAGLAEAAKHAMIDSKSLSISPPPTLAAPQSDQDATRWNDWLHKSADLKMKVVVQDLNDQGIRNQLNLGHTVGHALESHFAMSDSPWLHGEAVAVGLHFALYESEHANLSKFPLDDFDQTQCLQMRTWLLTHVPVPKVQLPEAEVLWAGMQADKKNAYDAVRDIAWRGHGKLVWPVEWKKASFEATWGAFSRSWNEAIAST